MAKANVKHARNPKWRYFVTHHADRSYEQTYALATADIAREFIAEMDAPTVDDIQPEPKAHSKAPTATHAPMQGQRGHNGAGISWSLGTT